MVLAIAAALAACSGEGDESGPVDAASADVSPCTPPAELTYDCTPVPFGTPNSCSGGAHLPWDPDPNPGNAYPLGCNALLPFCVGAYPNAVQECTCDDFAGTPEWICPV